MAETLTLTAAEVKTSTTTDYHVTALVLNFAQAFISIQVRGTNGEQREFIYEGQTAIDLMVALNKANLSVKSLQRRTLERLIADGRMAGAVTGVPD